jgi:uncharacterized protein YegL
MCGLSMLEHGTGFARGERSVAAQKASMRHDRKTFCPAWSNAGTADRGMSLAATTSGWDAPTLTPKGNTPMGAAIEQGLQMLESQKAIYKNNGIPHYRPWVFLITDGGPTDSWENAARLVHEGEAKKKFKFFAVGVEQANFDILKKISVGEPIALKETRFRDLFAWLSSSLAAVSQSNPGDEVKLENPTGPNGWGSIV